MHRIHLILMQIRILDPDPGSLSWIRSGKKWIWIRIQVMNISLRCTEFFNKAELSNYFFSYFFAYFYAKSYWTNQRSENFYNFFFSSLNLGFVSEKVFLSFWLKFFQNPADQTDPDPGPKHCNINYGFCIIIVYIY